MPVALTVSGPIICSITRRQIHNAGQNAFVLLSVNREHHQSFPLTHSLNVPTGVLVDPLRRGNHGGFALTTFFGQQN